MIAKRNPVALGHFKNFLPVCLPVKCAIEDRSLAREDVLFGQIGHWLIGSFRHCLTINSGFEGHQILAVIPGYLFFRTASELMTGIPSLSPSARARTDFPLPVRPQTITRKGLVGGTRSPRHIGSTGARAPLPFRDEAPRPCRAPTRGNIRRRATVRITRYRLQSCDNV